MDLPGAQLGSVADNIIYIDANAAGYGWFVDVAPIGDNNPRRATDSDQAASADNDGFQRMDLLTVLMHEMGHILGFDDRHDPADASDLMFWALEAGDRKALWQQDFEEFFASDNIAELFAL